MSTEPRIRRLQIRASDEEIARWTKVAEGETLSLSTWARRELERAARRKPEDENHHGLRYG